MDEAAAGIFARARNDRYGGERFAFVICGECPVEGAGYLVFVALRELDSREIPPEAGRHDTGSFVKVLLVARSYVEIHAIVMAGYENDYGAPVACHGTVYAYKLVVQVFALLVNDLVHMKHAYVGKGGHSSDRNYLAVAKVA